MELTPYEKNAKEHPVEQVRLIATSLRDFGWQQPIKVGSGNVIIAGHGRYLAYKEYREKFNLKDPWVIDETGRTISGGPEERKLTALEERDYRLRDNKIAESEWDYELLIPELKELKDAGLELDLMGFSTDLIIEPDEKDDLVPNVPAMPKSIVGDLYEIGPHRVLCGDSTNIDHIQRLMNGKTAEMVFTDPPYNVDYQGGIHNDADQKKRSKILNDKMSSEDFYQFLSDVFNGIVPVVNGGFYVCMSSSELHNLWKAFTDAGGHWQEYIIWAKDNFTLSRTDYQQQFEPIMYGMSEKLATEVDEHYEESEGEAILYGWTKHQWYGGRKQGNVWHFDRPRKSKEHPTMKPVMLCAKAITNSAKKGEIVLDVFLGSGSTLIAAEKTGRVCYGIELDPKYVDVIVERWVDYTGNANILKNGQPHQWVKSSN